MELLAPTAGETVLELGFGHGRTLARLAVRGADVVGVETSPTMLAAAPVVARIFAEYIKGNGLYAIAEGLNRAGILSPSAYDPERNPHRSGAGWSKGAVWAILTNPRYTGMQVWNRQRKHEVLLDVDDVAMGHQTRMRWNPQDAWITSNAPS